MLQAVFIGLAVLTTMLIVIYRISIAGSISEKKANKKMIKKEERERSLEEKRILELKAKKEKHENKIKEIAQEVIKSQDKILENQIIKSRNRMNYDYKVEGKKLEEHRTFYEEKYEKLAVLNEEANLYLLPMEEAMNRLSDWFAYDNEYAQYIIDEIRIKSIDTVETLKKIYSEALFYKKQIDENIKEAEKLADEADVIIKSKKRFKKELMRFSNNATKFEDYTYKIDKDIIKSDAILVSEKGIFIIFIRSDEEGKYRKIHISEREEWYTEGYDIKERIKGVENYSHSKIEAFQRWLNLAIKSDDNEHETYFTVYPLIIVMDNDIEIENHSYLKVLKMEELFNHINFFKNKEIEKYELGKIIDVLNKNKIKNDIYELIDNIEALTENLEVFKNSYNMINLIDEVCVEFCKNVEKDTKIKIYRRYLAIKIIAKCKREMLDSKILEKKLNPNNLKKNELDNMLVNLIQDNMEECIDIPLSIVANICDVSLLKMQIIVRTLYKIEGFHMMDIGIFKAINRSLAEIIVENFSEEKLEDYMITEEVHGIPFYRFKHFSPIEGSF